jgi:hypothetical protein
MDNLDDLFLNEFLKGFEEQEQKKVLLSREQQQIAQRKSEELEPIRKFLQKFIDLEVKVKHCDYHSRDVLKKLDITNDAQFFSFYNEDSSDSFAPGISIMIDHPAQIEIAVPNNYEHGLFVVSVATEHPDSHILAQSYGSVESLCQALARFISKNTVSISKEAKSLMNKERQTSGYVKTIPQVNTNTQNNLQNNVPVNNNINTNTQSNVGNSNPNANNNTSNNSEAGNGNSNNAISQEEHEANSQEFLKSIPDSPPANSNMNHGNNSQKTVSNPQSTNQNRKFDADHLLKNMKHIDKIMKKHNPEGEDEKNSEE